MKRRLITTAVGLVLFFGAFAQEKVVSIKYGDMDHWVTRKIHESGIIGGNTKLLY